jgi:hypothetical protein
MPAVHLGIEHPRAGNPELFGDTARAYRPKPRSHRLNSTVLPSSNVTEAVWPAIDATGEPKSALGQQRGNDRRERT